MPWFRIKIGSRVSKREDGTQKITRTPGALGYEPGDEFLESDVDLAKADPVRWESVAGPAVQQMSDKTGQG